MKSGFAQKICVVKASKSEEQTGHKSRMTCQTSQARVTRFSNLWKSSSAMESAAQEHNKSYGVVSMGKGVPVLLQLKATSSV